MTRKHQQLERYEVMLRRATSGIMDAPDQKRLIGLVVSRTRHKTYLFSFGVGAILFTAWIVVGNIIPDSSAYDLPMFVLGVACALTAIYVVNRRRSPIARRMLSKSLYRKGFRPNFCLRCQYDLKGSVSEQCPECGEPLAPPVESGDRSAIPGQAFEEGLE